MKWKSNFFKSLKSKLACLLILLANHISFSQNNSEIHYLNHYSVIDTVVKYGPLISPTYEEAVCTELVIGILGKFIPLNSEDTIAIRIDQEINSIQDIYTKMENGSDDPKGVYSALIKKGVGIPIDSLNQVKAGDFVQFWYPNSWGHCGIVSSIDSLNNQMYLHSSYPSTNGYGIQVFDIPNYCFFVRLKLSVD